MREFFDGELGNGVYVQGRSRIARAVTELQGRSGMAYISLRAYVI